MRGLNEEDKARAGVIIVVVVIELIFCLASTLFIAVGSGGSDIGISPLNIWLPLAVFQLAIHYSPRVRTAQYGLALLLVLALFVGAMPGRIVGVTYPHQSLFIAGVAVVPQYWLEQLRRTAESQLRLGIIGFGAIPLGLAIWCFANIPIVEAEAKIASPRDAYCILASNGRLLRGGYHPALDRWNLAGWNMISGRGGGGSGNCCQWDFHAVLVTNDKRIFNWSYKSQRFEIVSERTRRLMGLDSLSCRAPLQ